MEPLQDTQLIEKYLKGDEQSLEILIQRYFKLVYSFVIRSLGNKEEAEDLTQEIFLKVWNNLKKFNPEKSFKTWIFTIAKNTLIDYFRKKKIYTVSSVVNDEGEEVDILDTIANQDLSALENIEQQEIKSELEKNLLKLSADDRMLLLFYYEQRMNFREIAEMLEEPVDTVKSRHRRALIKLRKFLANIK